jgi:hypothetical protein
MHRIHRKSLDRWFGHPMRMENNKLPGKAYIQRSGYKSKGRARWIYNVKDILKKAWIYRYHGNSSGFGA